MSIDSRGKNRFLEHFISNKICNKKSHILIMLSGHHKRQMCHRSPHGDHLHIHHDVHHHVHSPHDDLGQHARWTHESLRRRFGVRTSFKWNEVIYDFFTFLSHTFVVATMSIARLHSACEQVEGKKEDDCNVLPDHQHPSRSRGAKVAWNWYYGGSKHTGSKLNSTEHSYTFVADSWHSKVACQPGWFYSCDIM